MNLTCSNVPLQMNVAARMESTGVRDRIQLSGATAKLLIKAGKEHWIEKRVGKVDVKGKGSQETFFVTGFPGKDVSGSKAATVDTNTSSSDGSDHQSGAVQSAETNMAEKTARLVGWNTDVLARRVVAIMQQQVQAVDPDVVELSPTVVKQLRHFVEIIASIYNENPFHNFSHASHVTLSIEKMLSRVERNTEFSSGGYTNNICSDPLAQFAAVLAALIHDCDRKLSNCQLYSAAYPFPHIILFGLLSLLPMKTMESVMPPLSRRKIQLLFSMKERAQQKIIHSPWAGSC